MSDDYERALSEISDSELQERLVRSNRRYDDHQIALDRTIKQLELSLSNVNVINRLIGDDRTLRFLLANEVHKRSQKEVPCER